MVLLLLTGPLKFLPTCVLGAIVFVVAVGLIDFSGLCALRRNSPGEFYLAVATAAAVVFIGVERGIILAIALSLLQHVRHGYRPHTTVILRDPVEHWRMEPVVPGKMVMPGLVIYWFGADLYYANANHFVEQAHLLVDESPTLVRWLVVDAEAITGMDFSAGWVAMDLQRDLARKGVVLALTRVEASLLADLDRLEVTGVIGTDRLFHSRKCCLKTYEIESATESNPLAAKEP